jgi:hypothetical protein
MHALNQLLGVWLTVVRMVAGRLDWMAIEKLCFLTGVPALSR